MLRDSLEKLSTPEVQVRVIHQGVGAITEGDVLLAAASDAIVIGFHVKPDAKAQAAMQAEKVDVRLYTVIYEVVDEVRSAMSGLLAPELVEKVQGQAEVRQIFRITHVGVIAGCMIISGTIHRGDSVRLIRKGEKVWEGKIASLKRIKDDAREVASGFECGIGLEGPRRHSRRRRDRGLHDRGDRPQARVGGVAVGGAESDLLRRRAAGSSPALLVGPSRTSGPS